MHPTHTLEDLEPRVLLSAYSYQTLAQAFDFPSILHDLTPPQGVEVAGFGSAAAALGDLDGDGRPDFAIAAPGHPGTSTEPAVAGRVFVYSGATGQLIRTLQDGTPLFGFSLAGLGDVNGDGTPDLIVGSPQAQTDDTLASPGGAAYIFSGADGALLHTLGGAYPGGQLGYAVAAVADLSGDGVGDALVGAPGAGPQGQGQVYVVSGATGEVVRTFTGEAAGDRFGAAVISPGDVPTTPDAEAGDGVPDIFIGAPASDAGGADAGRAYLYSGANGALRLTFTGEAAGDELGTALGWLPRAGESGAFALLVGAPGVDTPGPGPQQATDRGEVYLFNVLGAAAFPDMRFAGSAPGERVGESITLVGDINGDGVADVALTRPRAPSAAPDGLFQIRSGRTSQFIVAASAVRPLLGAVPAAGDFDGDGFADILALDPADGHVRVISALGIVPPSFVNVASDDLSYLFNTFDTPQLVQSRMKLAIIAGRAVPLSLVPGLLHDDVVLGVNNQGLIALRRPTNDTVLTGNLFLVRDAQRTPLADAVTQVVGDREPNYDDFTLVEVGNDGSVLFSENRGTSAAPRATWLFKDGVLTFLWLGEVHYVNDLGVVLGAPAPAGGGPGTPVLRTAEGALTPLPGLTAGRRVSNLGDVLGLVGDDAAIWHDGTAYIMRPRDLSDGARSLEYHTFLFNDAGEAVLTASYTLPIGRDRSPVPFIATLVHKHGLGLATLDNLIFGPRAPIDTFASGVFIPRALTQDGRILLSGALVEPLPDEAPWTLRPDAPIGASAGTTVAAVNALGDPILLRCEADGRWTGGSVGFSSISGQVIDTHTYVDPRDGLSYIFILTSSNTFWGTVSDSGRTAHLTQLSFAPTIPPIVGESSLFRTADGRFVLAGASAGGDLVLYYQTNLFSPNSSANWNFDNIVTNHLQPAGQAFSPVAGSVTGFAAPWGASHIGYLDAAGQLHAVWIPPGGTQWLSVNLSENSGAAPLSGSLTCMVTPWRTLHFIASDAAGNPTAIWWAPGFEGQWLATPFAPEGAPRLDPTSLTALVTPWNALHLFGRDADTGEAVALWWAPATQEWRAERLIVPDAPEGVALTGELASSVTNGTTLNLFARQDDSHLAHLFWTLGDGADWSYQDVTAATRLAV